MNWNLISLFFVFILLLHICDEVSANSSTYTFQEKTLIDMLPDTASIKENSYWSVDKNITQISSEQERIYRYDLKLEYKDRSLSQISHEYFITKNELPSLKLIDTYTNAKPHHVDEFTSIYMDIEQDKVLPFFSATDGNRQWFRKHEESNFRPIIYRNHLIYRNYFRIFAYCLQQGLVVDSLAIEPSSGEEFTQTFMHPHHNAVGYGISLFQDTFFTEVDGALLAFEFNGEKFKNVWHLELGAFSTVSDPLVVGKEIVVTLYNSKSELWSIGVNRKTGQLLWSTFLGVTTSFSPKSNLQQAIDGHALIVTNYGLIYLINSRTGELAWIRSYKNRIKDLFEYWKDAKLDSNKKNLIPIDTQFLMTSNNLLWIKPRESDNLMMLQLNSGKLLKSEKIEKNNYLIGVRDGESLFLYQNNNKEWVFEGTILKSSSDKIFRGSWHNGNGTYFIKIDNIINVFENNFLIKTIATSNNNSNISGVFAKEIVLADESQAEILSTPDAKRTLGPKKSFFYEKKYTQYGDFIFKKEHKTKFKKKSHTKNLNKKDYHISGIYLEVLPIQQVSIKNKLLNYFLLVRGDQLVCITEQGHLKWVRNINRLVVFLRVQKGIQAFLYENTIIIKDAKNIFALDADNGEFIWSLSSSKNIPSSVEPRLNFSKNILYATVDGRVLYKINLKNYEKSRSTMFSQDSVEDVVIDASAENIFLFNPNSKSLITLRKDLSVLSILSLDKNFEINQVEMGAFDANHLKVVASLPVLFTHQEAILFNSIGNEILDRVKYSSLSKTRIFAEVVNDAIVLISPPSFFWKYRIENKKFIKVYKKENKNDLDSYWSSISEDDRYRNFRTYISLDEKLIFLNKLNNRFFFTVYDTHTAKKISESENLNDYHGPFLGFSNYTISNDKLCFILSERKELKQANIQQDLTNIFNHFVIWDMRTPKIDLADKSTMHNMPTVGLWVTQTANKIIRSSSSVVSILNKENSK